jgi:tryptophan 7-halogenase
VTRLIQLLRFSVITRSLVNRYNEKSRIEYERIRDFIILHYNLSEREDTPLWRDFRHMEIPDSLAQRIELFDESCRAYQATDEMFRVES